jgi:hypothetical protein
MRVMERVDEMEKIQKKESRSESPPRNKTQVVTSAEVVGEPTPAAPEDVKYTTGPDTIWPPNVTPQVKESHPEDIGTNLGSPSPSSAIFQSGKFYNTFSHNLCYFSSF